MSQIKLKIISTLGCFFPAEPHFSYLNAVTSVNKSIYVNRRVDSSFITTKSGMIMKNLFLLPFVAAYPKRAQIGFQEPVSPVMEGIIDFHHDLMFFLAFILGFVCWFLYNIGYSFIANFTYELITYQNSSPLLFQNPYRSTERVTYVRAPSRKNHHLWLEIIWTIIPALILVSIVLPSFALIYSMDEFFLHPRLTLKAIGNQWYWTYNYGCALEYKTDEKNYSFSRAFAIWESLNRYDPVFLLADESVQRRKQFVNNILKPEIAPLKSLKTNFRFSDVPVSERYEFITRKLAATELLAVQQRRVASAQDVFSNKLLTNLSEMSLSPTPRYHFALKFDSYMKSEDSLLPGQMRLLEVDKRVLLPTLTGIRLLVSSYDVLHSWAVPSFGIKLDGCPGRLNQTFLYIKEEGLFYGQCSEICGVNHAFMPIAIRTISSDEFNLWLAKRISIFDSLIKESKTTIKNEMTELNDEIDSLVPTLGLNANKVNSFLAVNTSSSNTMYSILDEQTFEPTKAYVYVKHE